MQRIAVCISGHVSNERMALRWNAISESYRKAYYELPNHDYFMCLSYSDKNGQDLAEKMLRVFQPKAHVVMKDSPAALPLLPPKKSEGNIQNTLKMFEKTHVTNELKKNYALRNKKQYKYSFRCRPDMVFLKRASIPIFVRLGIWHLAIPIFPWGHVPKFAGAQTDWYAIGQDKAMDIYSDVKNHLNDLVSEGVLFHAETLLGNHIKRQQLRVLKIRTPCFFEPEFMELNGYKPPPDGGRAMYQHKSMLIYSSLWGFVVLIIRGNLFPLCLFCQKGRLLLCTGVDSLG